MRIRPLVESDLPLLRTWMTNSAEAPAWSDDDLAGIVQTPSGGRRRVRRGWIAEAEETEEEGLPAALGFIVATALCIPNPDIPAECELEFVFVAPEARRQGIGRTLLHTLFAWASDLGAEDIRLEVRAGNTRALRLYQHCGFTLAGKRPGYYVDPPEDAVLMHRRIERGRGVAPV